MGMSQKILHRLSQTTNVFGLKLWAVVTICTAMVILVTVFVVWVWGFSNRRRPKLSSSHHCKLSSSKAAQRIGADDDDDDGKKNKENKKVKIQVLESSQQRPSPVSDAVSVDVTISQQKKEMQGKDADGTMDSSSAVVQNHCKSLFKGAFSWTQVVALGPRSVSGDVSPMMMMRRRDDEMHPGAPVALPFLQKHSEMAVAAAAVADESSDMFASQSVPRNESSWTDESSSRTGSRSSWSADFPGGAAAAGDGSDLGWGQWYTLREIETATHGFAEDTLLGEGGYGIVYRGELPNGTLVAVKNLLNNKGQAEREFRVEVEAIGRVRHKNLVRLLGYCAEGPQRMLVYEYVDNGNLEQWLHGPLAESNPLTWEARMRIVLGTAKALAYLHEALEPKVVHRDIKSSNILVDTTWNAKVSDFGLAKLLGSDKTHVTTRVMGTFGYVAPEYCSTGLLTERSDVYSFGVLLMEVITGRDPVDYSRATGEVNLVDWLKQMVGNRRSEEAADPNMRVKPTTRALKRALLVSLRCVDPDAQKRPKMGHVVHMLEADDFPF